MDRRRFLRRVPALAGVPLVLRAMPPQAGSANAPAATGAMSPAGGASPPPDLRIDGERLNGWLDELATYGRLPNGGNGRVAFSEADLESREWITDLMEAAGMETRVDAASNLLGRRPGSEEGLPPLLLGSHTDSVPEGGHYDGPVGSMAALEAVRTIHDHGHRTRHPLEVVIWTNEEGGKTGSRAWSGEVEPMELDLETASGRTIAEGLRFLGGDPGRLDEVRRGPGDVATYLELHVEQGAVLDRREIDVGVVQGIVGIKRWTVTVTGFANHAGTTPMDQRRDALVAAARFVDEVHLAARQREGSQVATVGRIEARPGAPNVIPGEVVMSLEIRDLAMETIDQVFADVRERARRIAGETDTEFGFERFYRSGAAPTDPRLRDAVEDAAEGLGLSSLRMPSGAGHDAQSVAKFAPVGMIFVPSEDGISHSPRERTLPGDVVNGGNVLLHALLAADAERWSGPGG